MVASLRGVLSKTRRLAYVLIVRVLITCILLYTLSATANSFVPFYISSNIVMHSARNALEHVKRLRRDPLRATA